MLLKKKARQENQLLQILRTYSKQLRSILNLKDLLRNLLRSLVEIAQADSGNILLFEKEIKAFVVRESHGGNPLLLQFQARDPFLNYLNQTAKFLTKHRLVQDPTLIDIKESGLRFMTTIHAELVFPMQVENKVVGIITLGSRQSNEAYSPEHLELLEVLVSMASISVGNAILNDSLEKQNVKLAEIANLKTQFVSTISHELSTPLNGILGLTQVLLDPDTSGPLTDDQHRYLQMIQSAGEELSDVVNQILDLTRFQSQKGSLEVRRVDFAKAVDSVRDELNGFLVEKGVRCDVDLGSYSNVYGDEGQIKQVVQSLLENAVKFTPDNTQKVIGIQAGKHGDMLKICIYDSGIGVEEKDQDVIFDDFRQADGEVNRTYGGTGLGLALAKKIIELHGGRIWVESKKGEGSQFFFTLPLKPGLVQAPEIETQRQ